MNASSQARSLERGPFFMRSAGQIAWGRLCPLIISILIAGTACAIDTALIATDVAKDVGTVVKSFNGEKGTVIVFEEYHNSRAGQVEIATMLTRLRHRHHLRKIGLEGAIDKGTPLPKYLPSAKDDASRHELLRQQLRVLEISGVEYVAAMWSDIEVFGLEKEDEYNVKPGESGEFKALVFLGATLSTGEKQLALLKALQEKDGAKMMAALRDSDPWVASHLASSSTGPINLADQIKRANEILTKVKSTLDESMQADIIPDLKQSLRFYEIADKRSITMCIAVEKLAANSGGQPIAMIIGGAHSEKVMAELQSRGIGAVLISPLHYQGKDDTDGLTAFEQKSNGLFPSNAENSLDRILNDARQGDTSTFKSNRKPPPTIGDATRVGYASAKYVAILAAQSVRDQKTFPDSFIAEARKLPGIKLQEETIRKVDQDVIFCIDVDGLDGKPVRVWLRAGTKKQPSKSDSLGESMSKLDEAEVEAGAGGNGNKKPPSSADSTTSQAPEPSNNGKHGENGKPGEKGKTESTGKTEAKASLEVYKMVETKWFKTESEAASAAVISDL